jgi:putative acetyltransferase
MNALRAALEDPRSPIAAALIAELSAELAPRYPGRHGGDGSAGFKPDDVTVPRAAFVVVWEGDSAVGCGALRPMADSTTAEIKRMYVRPAARGQGISRLILSALEDQARGFGYQKVLLETGTLQTEAISLYQTSGYHRIPCYGIYVNEPLSLCYEKMLSSRS